MLANVKQVSLAKALKHVIKAVAVKSTLPILSNVLVRAVAGTIEQDAHLRLEGTNLETALVEIVPAEVITPGKVTVPATDLEKLVSALNKKAILTLELNDNTQELDVRVEENVTTLKGIDANEWPLIKIEGGNLLACLPVNQFNRLAMVYTLAATDEVRPLLTTVNLAFDPYSIEATASDGYRLANEVLQGRFDRSYVGLIPARALKMFVDCMNKKLPVDIIERERQFVITQGDLALVSEQVEGTFPEYQNIIPKNVPFGLYINRDAFAQICKILEPLTKSISYTTRLKITEPVSGVFQAVFSVTSAEKGINQQTAKVGWTSTYSTSFGTGKDTQVESEDGKYVTVPGQVLDCFEIAFNVKYMGQILKLMECETVWIGLSKSNNPLHLKGIGLVDSQWVIMPMYAGR